jgi:hypothetical protein
MKDLILTKNQFNSDGFWSKPIDKLLFIPTVEDVALFDQNGYDLTDLEKLFANSNNTKIYSHREHRTAIKNPWFDQKHKIEGAVLNHSLLFERKGFTGDALQELTYWSKKLPLVHKIISMRPKWGLDFSMDYVDQTGNAFEVLHWEYDGFDVDELNYVKQTVEPILNDIDWDDAGKSILDKKDEWHHLGFFDQSDWKCNYFGVPKERFKLVCWK